MFKELESPTVCSRSLAPFDTISNEKKRVKTFWTDSTNYLMKLEKKEIEIYIYLIKKSGYRQKFIPNLHLILSLTLMNGTKN